MLICVYMCKSYEQHICLRIGLVSLIISIERPLHLRRKDWSYRISMGHRYAVHIRSMQNKGLEKEVAQLMGVEHRHQPGQTFCNIRNGTF